MEPEDFTVVEAAEELVFRTVFRGGVEGCGEFPVTLGGINFEAGWAGAAVYLVCESGALDGEQLLGGSGGLVAESVFVAAVADGQIVEVAAAHGLIQVEGQIGFVDVLVVPLQLTTTGAAIGDEVGLILRGEVIEELHLGAETGTTPLSEGVFIRGAVDAIDVNAGGLPLQATFKADFLNVWVVAVFVYRGLAFEHGAPISAVFRSGGNLESQGSAEGEFAYVVVFHDCGWMCAWHGASF